MNKIEIADVLRKHSLWLTNDGNGERADLRGADLRGANLRGADLQRANLRGANLRGASLQDVYLQDAGGNKTEIKSK